MWRKLGITARISILFIIVIVILILMSGLAMYINIYNIFRERVVEDLTQLSLQIKYNIDAIISGVDQATMHLYTDATIIEALSNSNNAVEPSVSNLFYYIIKAPVFNFLF
jgi:sensor histidine kinase regulating citrate/malate metabolism